MREYLVSRQYLVVRLLDCADCMLVTLEPAPGWETDILRMDSTRQAQEEGQPLFAHEGRHV